MLPQAMYRLLSEEAKLDPKLSTLDRLGEAIGKDPWELIAPGPADAVVREQHMREITAKNKKIEILEAKVKLFSELAALNDDEFGLIRRSLEEAISSVQSLDPSDPASVGVNEPSKKSKRHS